MNFFMLKLKLKSLFVDDYYCDCHIRSHGRPIGVGFVGAFVGVAVGLLAYQEICDEVEKRVCPICS